VTLALITGAGLLLLRPWARIGALHALPACLLSGLGMMGFLCWTRLFSHTRNLIAWTDPRLLHPFAMIAVPLFLLTAALIVGLTRPQVKAELQTEETGDEEYRVNGG
jgi:hypothetical protein